MWYEIANVSCDGIVVLCCLGLAATCCRSNDKPRTPQPVTVAVIASVPLGVIHVAPSAAAAASGGSSSSGSGEGMKQAAPLPVPAADGTTTVIPIAVHVNDDNGHHYNGVVSHVAVAVMDAPPPYQEEGHAEGQPAAVMVVHNLEQ